MLELGFIGLTILMTIIISTGYYQVMKKIYVEPSIVQKKLLLLLIPLALWFTYTYVIGSSGFLQNFDFPPRFAIFLIFPAFLFTGIFLAKNHNSELLKQTPTHWLTYYQTFRVLIESLFIVAVAKGILHSNVTLEGYNYDFIFALTAPVIGYLVFTRKALSKKALLRWNYFGLLVIAFIIFLFNATIYIPQLFGDTENLMPLEFAQFPYILVASFLMPSAVFMHVFSIIQLTKELKK